MNAINRSKVKKVKKKSSAMKKCDACGCDTWGSRSGVDRPVYCSLYCKRKIKTPEQFRHCVICGDEFYQLKGEDNASIRRGEKLRNTCSVKCGKIYQAMNAKQSPLEYKPRPPRITKKNHRKTLSKLFEDENHFCDVVERKILGAAFNYTREAYKITQDKLRRCDFVISIKTRHQQNVKIAVECKIDQKTTNMDCCLGQAIVSAAIHDATPCVCVPSDFHPDKDYTEACKKYGIILCNEINVIEKIKESL